jgi:osmotically-inducible protein OsmY
MKYGTLLVLAVAAVAASGCSHTIQGVQQDAKQNAPVVQAAAQQAAQSIQQAGKTTDKTVTSKLNKMDTEADVTLLGTRIKARIITDKQLNAPHNEIKVAATSTEVILNGHVTNVADKAKAETIAKAVIAEQKLTVGLKDQLTVQPS